MGRLKCGHNETWTMRLIDRGIRHCFCIGCLFERVGLKDILGRDVPNVKPHSAITKTEKNTNNSVVTKKSGKEESKRQPKSNPLVDRDIQTTG